MFCQVDGKLQITAAVNVFGMAAVGIFCPIISSKAGHIQTYSVIGLGSKHGENYLMPYAWPRTTSENIPFDSLTT